MSTSLPSPMLLARRRPRRRTGGALLALVVVAGLLGACTDDPGEASRPGTSGPSDGAASGGSATCAPDDVPAALDPADVARADTDGTTLKLVTHDSFATSDGIFDEFTAETGIEVELLTAGDAGTLVSQSVLTAGDPVADVLFGIDTTFLCRGTRAGVFTPYAAAALADVPDDLEQAPDHLLTPIDVGDVCLNYSKEAFPEAADAPRGLDDLTSPAFADAFVTENPETSSPGFAFLLATIATHGEDGWEDYWKELRQNGLQVDPSWDQAYNESFGAGSGDRTIVTSYATSPVADVLYADPPRSEPAIGVVADACFRQVEFAGILRGTEHPQAAAKLVDFLLSPRFQEDIPLNMFVEPANGKAQVPAEFEANRTPIDDPLTLGPAEIEAGRDRWTERWTEIVLR
jgi:thiamine transport system substrate-binding protein